MRKATDAGPASAAAAAAASDGSKKKKHNKKNKDDNTAHPPHDHHSPSSPFVWNPLVRMKTASTATRRTTPEPSRTKSSDGSVSSSGSGSGLGRTLFQSRQRRLRQPKERKSPPPPPTTTTEPYENYEEEDPNKLKKLVAPSFAGRPSAYSSPVQTSTSSTRNYDNKVDRVLQSSPVTPPNKKTTADQTSATATATTAADWMFTPQTEPPTTPEDENDDDNDEDGPYYDNHDDSEDDAPPSPSRIATAARNTATTTGRNVEVEEEEEEGEAVVLAPRSLFSSPPDDASTNTNTATTNNTSSNKEKDGQAVLIFDRTTNTKTASSSTTNNADDGKKMLSSSSSSSSVHQASVVFQKIPWKWIGRAIGSLLAIVTLYYVTRFLIHIVRIVGTKTWYAASSMVETLWDMSVQTTYQGGQWLARGMTQVFQSVLWLGAYYMACQLILKPYFLAVPATTTTTTTTTGSNMGKGDSEDAEFEVVLEASSLSPSPTTTSTHEETTPEGKDAAAPAAPGLVLSSPTSSPQEIEIKDETAIVSSNATTEAEPSSPVDPKMGNDTTTTTTTTETSATTLFPVVEPNEEGASTPNNAIAVEEEDGDGDGDEELVLPPEADESDRTIMLLLSIAEPDELGGADEQEHMPFLEDKDEDEEQDDFNKDSPSFISTKLAVIPEVEKIPNESSNDGSTKMHSTVVLSPPAVEEPSGSQTVERYPAVNEEQKQANTEVGVVQLLGDEECDLSNLEGSKTGPLAVEPIVDQVVPPEERIEGYSNPGIVAEVDEREDSQQNHQVDTNPTSSTEPELEATSVQDTPQMEHQTETIVLEVVASASNVAGLEAQEPSPLLQSPERVVVLEQDKVDNEEPKLVAAPSDLPGSPLLVMGSKDESICEVDKQPGESNETTEEDHQVEVDHRHAGVETNKEITMEETKNENADKASEKSQRETAAKETEEDHSLEEDEVNSGIDANEGAPEELASNLENQKKLDAAPPHIEKGLGISSRANEKGAVHSKFEFKESDTRQGEAFVEAEGPLAPRHENSGTVYSDESSKADVLGATPPRQAKNNSLNERLKVFEKKVH